MATKRIRFLWNNLFDGGTITSLSAATGFPVSYLKHRWHTRHWRSTGLADEWIKVDLGSAQDIQALVIKYHNFQVGASVKIQAHASDAWGAPSLDTTLTVTTDQIVKLWETAQTYRWWRLIVTDAGNSDGYSRIGRIYLGSYFQPTYDISVAPQFTTVDPSINQYSFGGQVSAAIKDHYKIITYKWNMIPETDKTTFDSIFDHVGQSKPYFICRDPDNVADTTYYIQNISGFDYIPKIHGWYGLTISVETMR